MSYGIYRNNEGYSDPTAGAAMSNILRDQKRSLREASRKLHGKERRRANRRLKHLRKAEHKEQNEMDAVQKEDAG